MCFRGSRTGADGREFAGFESVRGGVRGILVLAVGRQLLLLAVFSTGAWPVLCSSWMPVSSVILAA